MDETKIRTEIENILFEFDNNPEDHPEKYIEQIMGVIKAIPIEPPAKPDACRWDDSRINELGKLVDIIQEVGTINQGSSFLQKMGKIIYEAKQLNNSSIAEHRDSFLRFLQNLAIEAKGKHSI